DDLNDARRLLNAIAAVKSDSMAASGAAARLETLADYERRVAAQQERYRAAAAAAAAAGAARTTLPPEPVSPSTERANAVRPDATRDRQTVFLLRKVRPGEERVLGALTRVDCAAQTVRFTVEAPGRKVVVSATSFADIELTAFLDDKDFAVACG